MNLILQKKKSLSDTGTSSSVGFIGSLRDWTCTSRRASVPAEAKWICDGTRTLLEVGVTYAAIAHPLAGQGV